MRRFRKKSILVGTAVVAALGVVAGIGILAWPKAAAPTPENRQVESVEVTRGDLVERVRVTGKLGYGDRRDLGTSLGGTITGLPAVGGIVKPGDELFRVDDHPVVLFSGTLPVWRGFAIGMTDGADVQQLEQNLSDLGFFFNDPDTEFTDSTAEAILAWQKSLGLERTGSIEQGRIVFEPSAVRVAERKASVGSPASAAVLGVSGLTTLIRASVDPGSSSAVAKGAEISVELPDGTSVKGRVSSVGTPVEQDDPNSPGSKKLMLPVTIVLKDPAGASGLDGVNVNVTFAQVKSKDALQVPVLALLARNGGGFAVEVLPKTKDANGSKDAKGAKGSEKSTLVPVELGVFAAGMVEVAGGKLAVGDRVVVGE